jgi:hypothetical protein
MAQIRAIANIIIPEAAAAQVKWGAAKAVAAKQS